MHFHPLSKKFDIIDFGTMKPHGFFPFIYIGSPNKMNWHPKSCLISHLKMHDTEENSKTSIGLLVEILLH
jgi:hypothetical protein